MERNGTLDSPVTKCTAAKEEAKMGGKDHEINTEDPYESLVSWITKNELEKVRPRSSTTCIYKVPDVLRRANEAAYTPKVVSIGPIHHEKSLNVIKDYKRQFLKRFLQRTNKDLTHYVKIVKDSEERLRDCYQETFEFSSDEFCHIILVDAVFIVELYFSCYAEGKEVHLQLPDVSEWSFYARQVLSETWPELLLLENQLPFFILEGFWKDACSTTESIVRLFRRFYRECSCWDFEEKEGTNLDEMPMHFVDLVRKLQIPRNRKTNSAQQEWKTHPVPNATELHQAGIKFRVGSSKNLFDISFCKGVLEIPKLTITDSTESIMRNLAAFEQCHYRHKERYICQYLLMLDYLVNTHNDVNLLVKKKILENGLGDNNSVSAMINKLCVGVNIEREHNYFGDIYDKLDRHYRKRWNKWKANLKKTYFNTPWAAISLFVNHCVC